MALALTVEFNPLSAEHQYFPDLLLKASKLRVSFVPTVFPSLVHVIFGAGLPVALQWNVTVEPSMIVTSCGLELKFGATAKDKLNFKIKRKKISTS